MRLLPLALVFLCSAAPQDDFKPEEGFTLLFNGRDLTGWTYGKEALDGKTETPDQRFQVVGGVIVANDKDAQGKGGIKDLYTAASFDRDFQLKLEFRAGLKADSGVYLRRSQLQVRDYIRRGEMKHLTKFKDDGWNELDITVRNNVVVTTVNGKTLTPQDTLEVVVKDGRPEAKLNGKAVDANDIQVSQGPAADCLCNGESLGKPMRVPASGPLGLQAETGKFEFRRVRLKLL
jgi:hypothetical protein